MFYLFWVAGLDIETQLKGIVVIIWPVADVAMNHIKNKEHLMQVQKERLKGTPIRTCAFHFCVPDSPFCYMLRTIFALTLDKTKRCRLKFHIGESCSIACVAMLIIRFAMILYFANAISFFSSNTGHPMELRYLVKGYGIPVDHIPLTETGNVKTQNLRKWMKLRCTLEEGNDGATHIIECPGSNDVLFRPSKLIKGHPGNVKFQSLIEYYHEIGLGVTAASKEIIAVILKDDGRILVWDKRGWWTKLIDPAQRQFKVSVSYRDYKKKNKAKLQVSNSSTFAFQQQEEGKKRRRLSCPSSNSSPDTFSSTNICNNGVDLFSARI